MFVPGPVSLLFYQQGSNNKSKATINQNKVEKEHLFNRKEGSVLFNDALNTFYLREERKRNVLFNDELNTFYLRLYGVRHNMVKDHSNREKGNPLPPHRLLFSISSKGSFICIIPQRG